MSSTLVKMFFINTFKLMSETSEDYLLFCWWCDVSLLYWPALSSVIKLDSEAVKQLDLQTLLQSLKTRRLKPECEIHTVLKCPSQSLLNNLSGFDVSCTLWVALPD